jgi:hypothetical protein
VRLLQWRLPISQFSIATLYEFMGRQVVCGGRHGLSSQYLNRGPAGSRRLEIEPGAEIADFIGGHSGYCILLIP